jgi:maltose alpha-D-glucosyltransferase/alpha-amylase
MRKKFKAFGRGAIEFLYPENPKILAFLRQHQQETLLVVINLSRYAQVAELDLSQYTGYIPHEVFSGNVFPVVKDTPYVFTLGIHDYFWFILHKEEDQAMHTMESFQSEISLPGTSWEILFKDAYRGQLESSLLPAYLPKCRWFRSKSQVIRSLQVREDILLTDRIFRHHLLILEVAYIEEASELYLLPLSFLEESRAKDLEEEFPQAIIAKIHLDDHTGLLYDGVFSPDFRRLFLGYLSNNSKIAGVKGQCMASLSQQGIVQLQDTNRDLESSVLKTEQTNTSILYQSDFYLKLYRKIEEGLNPDSEMSAYLSEVKQFPNVPVYLAQLQYYRPGNEPMTLGLIQEYVLNQGDAWTFCLDHLNHYFEALLAQKKDVHLQADLPTSYFKIRSDTIPDPWQQFFEGYFLEMISLLGKITGELHLNLAQDTKNQAFRPEPFSTLYQRSLYQSMRHLVRKNLNSLRKNSEILPEELQEEIRNLVSHEQTLLETLAQITQQKINSQKIRIHGDYHLGQVMFTGNNFVIIDFEGEPARALSERRLKRSCFRDIAGMLRSFHYASYAALYKQASIRPDDIPFLQHWAHPWHIITGGVFLNEYLDTVSGASFIPQRQSEMEVLLNIFLLEKAVYELGYELNNRPDWIHLPIQGIKQILAI